MARRNARRQRITGVEYDRFNSLVARNSYNGHVIHKHCRRLNTYAFSRFIES